MHLEVVHRHWLGYFAMYLGVVVHFVGAHFNSPKKSFAVQKTNQNVTALKCGLLQLFLQSCAQIKCPQWCHSRYIAAKKIADFAKLYNGICGINASKHFLPELNHFQKPFNFLASHFFLLIQSSLTWTNCIHSNLILGVCSQVTNSILCIEHFVQESYNKGYIPQKWNPIQHTRHKYLDSPIKLVQTKYLICLFLLWVHLPLTKC